MKIRRLQITNYKNLDANLVHNSDLIAFIGNNGSGKSNLLEAVSHIFRSLYVPKYKVNFNYTIEYITSKNNNVKIEKDGKNLKYFLDGNNKSATEISNYLPQKVVGIYSGEETRLFDDCFGPFYLEFVNNINKAQSQGTEYSELPKMLFLNRYYWNIALLCLLISDSQDNQKFVKDVLRITNLDKIKIKIDFIKRNYANYNDNFALRLVRDIDAKSEYTLKEFVQLINKKEYTPDQVFKYLYLAYAPKDAKIIDGIIIEISEGITVADLSEGEKKLLLIKAALEFAGQEDSIFILDEPDSHIHINNKEQITNSFTEYLHNRQIIITTHSPTLTQCVNDENVYMLNNGKIEDRTRQEIIAEVTGEFWNKHQQNSFLSSKKPIILLVEGKHDKEHISNAFDKLQEEFPSLKFDIFKLNGETNILPFMRGLYESDFDSNKLYIGIYDNDGAGKTTLENRKFFESIANASFKKIIENQKANNSYFAFALPKPDNINCDCTIETMFDSSKFENAYLDAFEKTIGHFNNKSIDS
ncbi:MAG: AAA family ATPase, partial [Weeksellaceae bacterium]|nr:AAA family ATPase [Weeksellaceae bacterium]